MPTVEAFTTATEAFMNAESFGRRLQELRVAAGLTQKQLAGESGIPQPTIAHWERGSREPLMSNAALLADALGVPVQSLYEPPVSGLKRGRGRPPKAKPPTRPKRKKK
jgi:transcriptional regulator with XRE-family HTH domain